MPTLPSLWNHGYLDQHSFPVTITACLLLHEKVHMLHNKSSKRTMRNNRRLNLGQCCVLHLRLISILYCNPLQHSIVPQRNNLQLK